MQLVYYTNEVSKEPFTLSTVIAKCAEVQHKNIRELIYRYRDELEMFGVLTFETYKPPKGSKGGRPTKVYRLNEQQATLLITWLDNTEPVRKFKLALVKAFYELKQKVFQLQLARELEKPQRRKLTDAIKDWPHRNDYSYINFTNLLLKEVTGMNAKQLKAHHQSDLPSLDLLTIEQHQAYYDLENTVTVLIDLEYTYQEIKDTIQGKEKVSA